MEFEIPPSPGAHGEKREQQRKVVDLVRARQERRARFASFKDWHIVRDQWRMALAQDGLVYIDTLAGGKRTSQVSMNATDLDAMIHDLQALRNSQRRYHERLRGAHLWIARPHPDNEGWLLVKHLDTETPFRPVKVGARREMRTPSGRTYKKNMPTCASCGKMFVVGERAYEAQRPIFRSGSHARICVGCTRPPREGLAEIEGGT